MTPLKTRPLTRQQIGEFIGSPRGVRAFEDTQNDITSQYEALTGASFITLAQEPSLGSERVLTLASGDLVGVDGGANTTYTLGLAASGVTANTYGGADKALSLTIDSKGRITSAASYALNTDNVTEGGNLYFTNARARAALSASSGITYNSATGAFVATSAGTYGAPTGTISRTSLASYVAGTTLTFSATYVQAELTTLASRLASIEAALQATSQTLAALVTDMRANGNLG